jgi:DNA-binding NarL/FixJ family response regulator
LKPETKKIIIADDHAVVRTGLQLILDETDDLEITGEARNGDELLEKLKSKAFRLVILDISMPGKDSLDVLKEIKTSYPALPVVIFTMNSDEFYAIRMIKSGASAYINKETNPAEIIHILRTVLNGRKYFTQSQTEALAQLVTEPSKLSPLKHESLTDREFQILIMLASGLKKTDIADKLAISKHTIGNHRNNILKKMNMATTSDLTKYSIQQGIIK